MLPSKLILATASNQLSALESVGVFTKEINGFGPPVIVPVLRSIWYGLRLEG